MKVNFWWKIKFWFHNGFWPLPQHIKIAKWFYKKEEESWNQILPK